MFNKRNISRIPILVLIIFLGFEKKYKDGKYANLEKILVVGTSWSRNFFFFVNGTWMRKGSSFLI